MAKKQFKAESKRLLDLMINSIYTHKEIFLREIISNASDAIDKLCYVALTDDKVGMNRSDFAITVSLDRENRTLTVSDNGIGMSKEELENLLENVCKIAAELGIHINRKKTRIVKISSKYKFLQIKYTLTDTGKVIKRINPDRVTAMRRKLKKLAVKVENEEADYDNVENMFRGWMGGHYKLLSREQRKNLIQLYEDLFSKEITIVNKKLIVSDRSA